MQSVCTTTIHGTHDKNTLQLQIYKDVLTLIGASTEQIETMLSEKSLLLLLSPRTVFVGLEETTGCGSPLHLVPTKGRTTRPYELLLSDPERKPPHLQGR